MDKRPADVITRTKKTTLLKLLQTAEKNSYGKLIHLDYRLHTGYSTTEQIFASDEQ